MSCGCCHARIGGEVLGESLLELLVGGSDFGAQVGVAVVGGVVFTGTSQRMAQNPPTCRSCS
jgi:hypothetical protein